MSFSNHDNSGKGQIKSFVTETELEELKRRREEEWKKVKDASGKPIIDRPEELSDRRSLYEQLQEQKDKKQEEWDEQFKFKNMIRGLNSDEAEFLDNANQSQNDLEIDKLSDLLALINIDEAVNLLSSNQLDTSAAREVRKSNTTDALKNNKKTQSQLLSGLVRPRKRSIEDKGLKSTNPDNEQSHAKKVKPVTPSNLSAKTTAGIPGIGVYSDSENSDND